MYVLRDAVLTYIYIQVNHNLWDMGGGGNNSRSRRTVSGTNQSTNGDLTSGHRTIYL